MILDITLPVLNEEKCLAENMPVILSFLDKNGLGDWILTIADNGSDDKTPDIAKQFVKDYPQRIRYIRLEQRGVGLANRTSWGSSTADYVGYMDIDLATDLQHLIDVKNAFENKGAKVVNGSRFLPESKVVGRKPIRKVTSFVLNEMMQRLLGNHFTDAMSGFKFFEKDVAQRLLKDVPNIPDWFVSAELLVRSEWAGINVYEIPIRWTDDPNSKAKIIKLAKQYIGHIYRLYHEKKGRW
jgi:glycosyltransferase involved in cell wall biosynthesis